jgi:hypothetical protein
MLNILFLIIIGLIIGLVLTPQLPKILKEGFKSYKSTKGFFPGSTLMDLKPIDWDYDFNWVKKNPITLENETKYNPDVKFISEFAHINELDQTKLKIKYKPMNASKLYEKKISI